MFYMLEKRETNTSDKERQDLLRIPSSVFVFVFLRFQVICTPNMGFENHNPKIKSPTLHQLSQPGTWLLS